MTDDEKLKEGMRVFDAEIDALRKTRDSLDGTFVRILDTIMNCRGKVVLTGMGKPGHISRKLAATFASLGTPAFYMHPADAMHGDLGMLSEEDVVIVISLSGESSEVISLIPTIKLIGSTLVAITANADSALAQAADIVQILPQFAEACHLGLAPTSSTTAELCYGDALAVAASEAGSFTDSDFAKFHPAGALGRRLLLKVDDVMASGCDLPSIGTGAFLSDAIEVMTGKPMGLVSVIDADCVLLGVITDGDLRRLIRRHVDLYTVKVDDVMTRSPKTVRAGVLAVDAMKQMRKHSVNTMPVVAGGNRLVGAVSWLAIASRGVMV